MAANSALAIHALVERIAVGVGAERRPMTRRRISLVPSTIV
jgi:hypothetical protein